MLLFYFRTSKLLRLFEEVISCFLDVGTASHTIQEFCAFQPWNYACLHHAGKILDTLLVLPVPLLKIGFAQTSAAGVPVALKVLILDCGVRIGYVTKAPATGLEMGM